MEARELPGGTVTLLFTDIEGSTRMLQELGREAYVRALTTHRRLLREAFSSHSGVEVEMQGDSFHFAFPFARDAVAAAVAGQRALLEHEWEFEPIRVRIGLHTGEPIEADGLYAGLDVHQAARVMSAGHGGQVLVSQRTAQLVDGELSAGIKLRELGEYRLKDLSAPQRLYQVGDTEFPPLKTLSPRTNLPIAASPLIGRERELAEAGQLLRARRLVTLVGPGGSGKTRLALQIAANALVEFPDGVWWVPLEAVRDPTLVLPTIASTLVATRELVDYVADKRLLLVLDNVEQLLDIAPGMSDLLATTPNLKLLVTSRESLRIGGEVEYAVEPLPESDALKLFCERALVVEPLHTVLEICRRLDFLPLALELAAARTKLMTPEQLLARLEQRLPILTGGRRDAPERQRTLRATIEWSYRLLAKEERVLFAGLAVFAGSFDLAAAEAVCEADLDPLQSLVEKSLVRSSGDRYSMLGTIREFALERLSERNDARLVQRRHALYYLAVAERAEQTLQGPDQRGWRSRLELDQGNFRSALSWSQEIGDAESGLRIAGALWRFWRTHNDLAEGIRVLDTLLRTGEEAPARLRARALVGASRLAMDQGDIERSVRLGEEALVAARASGEAQEIAAATENLGLMLIDAGATSRALALLEESVERFRVIGEPIGTADALNNLANALLQVGDTFRAANVGEEALALQRHADNMLGIAFVLHTLGYIALHGSDLDLARARLEESLLLFDELGDRSRIGDSLEGLAHVAAGRGEDHRAATLWAAGASIRSEAGHEMESAEAALHHSALARSRGRCGAAPFAAAWAEGTTLTPDQAIAFALATGHQLDSI